MYSAHVPGNHNRGIYSKVYIITDKPCTTYMSSFSSHRQHEFIDELDGAVVVCKAVNVHVRQLDAAASIVTFFGWLFLMCAILCCALQPSKSLKF